MKQINEQFLWDNIRKAGEIGKPPRDVIREMLKKGMIESPKQAWRTLEKWLEKGIYDYGCNIDMGWRTQDDLFGAG